MIYQHTITGTFISRPNRFIAHVDINGQTVISHVKNTGRCRELLIPGVTVILEHHPDAAALGRKTEYDLIGVYKGDVLINMDSQAPNRAAWEWLEDMKHHPGAGQILAPVVQPDDTDLTSDDTPADTITRTTGDNRSIMNSNSPSPLWTPTDIRREVTHGDSRFDLAFTLEEINGSQRFPAFMEVKGVTLETDGMAMFPDAPTERGIKHLKGLARAVQEGCRAYVLFVIQMKGIHGFRPNDITHPAFGDALRAASAAGVHVLAYDCTITPDTMSIDSPVPVILN